MVTIERTHGGRRRHAGERGMTLIEVLVSVAILGIIGGAIGTMFSIGYATLRPGGPQARLLASYNLSVLEEDLGRDGARASCIQVPPAGTQYGGCSATKFGLVSCPIADLCFGWPQVSDSTCHVADYVIGAGVTAKRTEFQAGVVNPLSLVSLTRSDAVNIVLTAPTPIHPPGETYNWLRALTLTITSTGVSNAPSQTLTLHPVATDPAGQSAAITSGGSPC